MTKKEVENKVAYLKKQLAHYEAELERMDQVLVLNDYSKVLKDYSIQEMNQLFSISPAAFEWMQENEWASIENYNYEMSVIGKDKVKIEG